MTHRLPHWKMLALMGIGSILFLVAEARLPLSAKSDMWLQIVWLLFFYGLVTIWITRESDALEQMPEPRDCVGRLIMNLEDTGLDEPTDEQGQSIVSTRLIGRQRGGNVEC